MARIRSIKPDYWRSESIARLPLRARLTFIALWSYVDDNGVGRDNERLIAAELYPLEEDPREAVDIVREDLAILARESRVIRYTVDGKAFLEVAGWDEHQRIDRPNKPRYPRSDAPVAVLADAQNTVVTGRFDEPSRNPRAIPSPGAGSREQGAGEKGSRGAGENTTSAAAADVERNDVDHVCNLLADLIEGNGSKRPLIGKRWRTAARLLIDEDGRSVEQIERAIRWSQADPFYRSIVMSMPKVRQHYDAMRLRAAGSSSHKPYRDPHDQSVYDEAL